MDKIYFSIIIPLFNKENQVKKTIYSVLNQKHCFFELLIVDDGSTDQSLVIAQEIAQQDDRIKIIAQVNKGVSAARNNGIKNAKYDFICCLDADDIWFDDFLQNILGLIQKYPDCGAYATNLLYDYGNRNKIPFNDLLPDCFEDGYINNYFSLFRSGKSILMPSNTCLRKDVFNTVGFFQEGVTLTEDSEMWCRVALKYTIAFTSKVCAKYIIEDKIPHIERVHYIVESLTEKINEKQIPKKYINDVHAIIEYQLLVSSLFFLLDGKKNEGKDILRKNNFIYYKKIKNKINILTYLPLPFILAIYYVWKRL